MNTISKIPILCGLIVLTAFSCEKDKDNSIPVEFKFRLLDTLGNEKKEFNQGENIIFSFLVVNKSSETIFLENFFPNDDFLRVYQRYTNESSIDYGIPHEFYIKIGGFHIKENDTLEIKYPWLKIDNLDETYWVLVGGKENSELPSGNYYTNFSQSFKINDIQTEEKYFEIKFTVK